MSLLDDLADRLTTQGVATTGTNLFKAVMPSTPDELIALFQTGGPAPVNLMAAGPGTAVVERPHVQALARAARPDTAHKRAQDVYFALDALGDVTINGVRYLSVYALQSPFFLNTDEAGRYVYAVNFECSREPATSS